MCYMTCQNIMPLNTKGELKLKVGVEGGVGGRGGSLKYLKESV